MQLFSLLESLGFYTELNAYLVQPARACISLCTRGQASTSNLSATEELNQNSSESWMKVSDLSCSSPELPPSGITAILDKTDRWSKQSGSDYSCVCQEIRDGNKLWQWMSCWPW